MAFPGPLCPTYPWGRGYFPSFLARTAPSKVSAITAIAWPFLLPHHPGGPGVGNSL